MLKIYIKELIKLITITITGKIFWNYRLYKKKYVVVKYNQSNLKLISTDLFAIVMQGPLIVDSNFTVETLKIYRHNFPEAIIILSTWMIADDIVKLLEKYNIYIIQNIKPENNGISNVNLQIVTSSAGVLRARDLGAQNVLKTRTDQRIYHPSLETYLCNLLKTFPLIEGLPLQINRLVGISLNTFKFRLYGVSDMFLYGHIDDMVRYFNIPLDVRTDSPEERSISGNTLRSFSTWRISEVYLCTEFLKSMGRDVNFTLADSFQVFRDHFVMIDHSAINLYWHKYTLNEDRYQHLGFFGTELGFNDWLVLYKSFNNMIIDETILDQPISNAKAKI